MDISITVLCGCVSLIIGIVGTLAATKNQSKKDGYFEGVVSAKLDNLAQAVEKLDIKLGVNTSELSREIDKKISQHIREWHDNK